MTLKPNSILEEASSIIYGDREKTYGHPSKNLEAIATYWSQYLKVTVTPMDVCSLMILLKLARLQNQPTHRDSQVDICGYAALMERLSETESTQVSPPAPESNLVQNQAGFLIDPTLQTR